MALARGSGILLHPTSLPGRDAIGDLGDGAHRFVDWLVRAGQRYWQIMPLVPAGAGNSPYSSSSAFAIDPLLISLDVLVGDGLLRHGERPADRLPDGPSDPATARERRRPLLAMAFDRLGHDQEHDHLREELAAFRADQGWWLEDYALFVALKETHPGVGWLDWPEKLKRRDPAALSEAGGTLREEVDREIFLQWVVRRQWLALRAYANERGVRIIGDIPIFVAMDSADVWANPGLFRVDAELRPTVVAGVPPDYFSATGQLWGNPIYDWAALAEDGYGWWVDRVRALTELVDVVRIDHFRGFAANWSVPSGAESAAGGRWEQGPGVALFGAIEAALGPVDIVVEDLGLITPDVYQLRDDLHLPGMAVLQFAFDGDPLNRYLPHMVDENATIYTGTHDNTTTLGWFWGQPDWVREQVRGYVGGPVDDPAWDLVRLAFNSVARLAIVPMQDVLRLGDETRMNVPGLAEGNWGWRMTWDQLETGLAEGLALLAHLSGRSADPPGDAGRDPYDYTAPDTAFPLHVPGLG